MDNVTQAQVVEWHDREWGGAHQKPTFIVAAKLCEEAGETIGACVKEAEGRRTHADILDEAGDVGIVLMVLADRLGTTIQGLINRRFVEVGQRKNPNR